MKQELTTQVASAATTDAAKAAAAQTLLVSGVMFGISAIVSLAFTVALATDPTKLTDAWEWTRQLPIAVQVLLWAILLPWMIALWIWSTPLALPMRIAAVVAILAVAEYLLFPWKRA